MRISFGLGLGLALVLPAALHAEPLTFDAALERAVSQAPELDAGEAGIAASRSAAIASDQLPDPKLSVSLENFPVSGPPAFSLTKEFMTMERVGVEQTFPNLAKRHARAARAQADIGLAEAGYAVAEQAVRLGTAIAWIDLYYARKRLAQLQLLDESLHDLQATVTARLASGSARPSQALEPDQLRAAVADRRSELVAEVAIAKARLVRFTGDPQVEIAGDPPPLEIDHTGLMAGIATLPRLRALDANTVAAEAETRIARAEKRPDWAVSASYGRRDPMFGDMVSLGVSIDLPIFSKRRQDPKIAARVSEAEQARYERMAGEREMVAALETGLADHAMHHQRLENARQTLVPLARHRAELDLVSYAAGNLDLGSALMSSLALAEAEVDALAREAEVARHTIVLNYTYGEDRQ